MSFDKKPTGALCLGRKTKIHPFDRKRIIEILGTKGPQTFNSLGGFLSMDYHKLQACLYVLRKKGEIVFVDDKFQIGGKK